MARRYSNVHDFMTSFVGSMTANIPDSKATGTYLRQQNRQRRQIIHEVAQSSADMDRIRAKEEKFNRRDQKRFNRAVERVKRKNPGLSKIKVRVLTRRLINSGRISLASAGRGGN